MHCSVADSCDSPNKAVNSILFSLTWFHDNVHRMPSHKQVYFMKKLVLTAFVLTLLCTGAAAAKPTIITGKVLSHDGRPMPIAQVVAYTNNSEPIMAEASADGSYTLTTESIGMMTIQFVGVGHERQFVNLLVDEPKTIQLDAKLSTYVYSESFDNVRIIGSFNSFDWESAQRMKRQPDGTYMAEFKTRQPEFAYQLLGVVADHSINGTQAEKYNYDGDGDWQSIVTPDKGKVRIVFDPKKLPPSGKSVEITFHDPQMRSFQEIRAALEETRTGFSNAYLNHIETGGDDSDFRYDLANDLAKISGSLKNERDPFLRQTLYMSYIALSGMGPNIQSDTGIIREALREIPATASIWELEPQAVMIALERADDPVLYDRYFQEILEKHPDGDLGGSILYMAVSKASRGGDKENFQRYYNLLQEKLPESQYAVMAKAEFDPNRRIQVGRQVPPFSIVSLDDPKRIVSTESMKGKVYLIDFWATWCGPCVGEMPAIHKAYERFHPRGFEIISLSFDEKPQAVKTFRKGEWKMPWLHVFIKDGFNNELAKTYEVMGIPKPILVDATGAIIATEEELRGPALEKTLTRVLGTPN